MNELIKNIAENITLNYPTVDFEINNDHELLIKAKNKDGFDILIQESERENTVHFGAWHFHFENNDSGNSELMDYLIYGMSKSGRLKAYSRSKNEYKWTFEIMDRDDNWFPIGTMSLMNFKFWVKPKVKYYHNEHIDLTQIIISTDD